jgi:murein DD-endopeptidase MepM/ murein hydrolase activator NlpD
MPSASARAHIRPSGPRHRTGIWPAPLLVLALAGCAVPGRPPVESLGLPHAVLVDDGEGRTVHLHVGPVVDGGRPSSGFGWRRSPMGGGRAFHEGIDIAAPKGARVRAAAAGQVAEMGWQGGYGRAVRIRHGEHLETLYAHLSGFAGHLEGGRRVRQDEVIGYVGATGSATGPHLHFEIRRYGKPLDPLALPRAGRGSG